MKYVCVICIISNCVSGPVSRGEEGQSCVWRTDTGNPSISPALVSCVAGRPRLCLASWLEAVVLASCRTTRLWM